MVPVWDEEVITWRKILLFPVERSRNSLRRTSCILPQPMLNFFPLFGPSTVIEGAGIGNHLLSTGGTLVTARAVSVLVWLYLWYSLPSKWHFRRGISSKHLWADLGASQCEVGAFLDFPFTALLGLLLCLA